MLLSYLNMRVYISFLIKTQYPEPKMIPLYRKELLLLERSASKVDPWLGSGNLIWDGFLIRMVHWV